MAMKDYSIRQEQLARFAKAMGHPARIAILQFLAKQETCYFGDIHEELPIAKATVSQHLKELKEAGLIQGEVEAPKVKYCINCDNWLLAHELFSGLFGSCVEKKEGCC
ncbi:MAG: metalloregulator ArsR/SmtB family transcription factor [Parabacteroides sp.]|nr:metalloregulator ArsR/SmtB family transcription factor [Parabacteroides sp.]